METPPPVDPSNPNPPAVPPAAAAPPPVPAAAAPPPVPAAAPPPAPPIAPSKDDEEKRASAIRDREKKKALKDAFGTDDEAEIEKIKAQRKKDSDDLAALRANKEKDDRESMSEVERLKTDLATANAKITELEGQIASMRNEVVSTKQDVELTRRMQGLAFIDDPDAHATVKLALMRHFNGLTKAQQAVFVRTGGLDTWLKGYAKSKPWLVKQAAPAAAPPPAAPPKVAPPPARVPAGGPRPPIPPKATGTAPGGADPLSGKTPRPGLSNSMTPAELKQYQARARQAGSYAAVDAQIGLR